MRLKIILGKTSETTKVVNAATGEQVEGIVAIEYKNYWPDDTLTESAYTVAIRLDVSRVTLELAEPNEE